MNKVFLTGRLARTPELRRTTNGKAVSTLTVAVDRIGDDTADFLDVVVWEKAAENACKYLAKGNQVAVEAHLHQRITQTEEGNRYALEIVSDHIEYLSPKNAEPNE